MANEDAFAQARGCFEDMLAWLEGNESAQLSHADLEDEIVRRGREAQRLAFQDHLDAPQTPSNAESVTFGVLVNAELVTFVEPSRRGTEREMVLSEEVRFGIIRDDADDSATGGLCKRLTDAPAR